MLLLPMLKSCGRIWGLGVGDPRLRLRGLRVLGLGLGFRV